MNASPLVSVLFPCFNAERFVADALQSILGQTYGTLEVVAIDDGSSDSTAETLARFAQRDQRVRVLTNSSNLGLVATLNRAIDEARGSFVARMDADDIAMPNRFAEQLSLLCERPDVDVVGSATKLVDAEGRALRQRPVRSREPAATRFMSLFATPVVHPTLFARANVFNERRYSEAPEAVHTEDYELIGRMIEAGVKVLNTDRQLLEMRALPTGISQSFEDVQIANFVACARTHLERTLGLRPAPSVHRVLVNRLEPDTTPSDLRGGLALLAQLETIYLRAEPAAAAEIRGIADEQRLDILIQALLRGSRTLRASALPLVLRNAPHLMSRRARGYAAGKVLMRSLPADQRR